MPMTSELCGKHEHIGMNPNPVNGITRGDARISKRRVCLRPHLRVIPPEATLCMEIFELWQSSDVSAPAKIIDDEASHTCGFGSVNQGDLMHDTGRPNNTNSGILTGHGLGQLVECVFGFDDGDSGWEGCHRVDPADYGHVKPGAHEESCDGCPKIPRGR